MSTTVTAVVDSWDMGLVLAVRTIVSISQRNNKNCRPSTETLGTFHSVELRNGKPRRFFALPRAKRGRDDGGNGVVETWAWF